MVSRLETETETTQVSVSVLRPKSRSALLPSLPFTWQTDTCNCTDTVIVLQKVRNMYKVAHPNYKLQQDFLQSKLQHEIYDLITTAQWANTQGQVCLNKCWLMNIFHKINTLKQRFYIRGKTNKEDGFSLHCLIDFLYSWLSICSQIHSFWATNMFFTSKWDRIWPGNQWNMF